MVESIETLMREYPLVAPFAFILLRTIPIIIVPIPGVVIDALGIAFFGWLYGLFLAQIGVMIGSITAFMMSRTFREPLVRRFVALEQVHQWEESFLGSKKFWTLVGIRIATSPVFDYVSYAAGFTTMSLRVYALTTLLGTFPLMFVIYYFGEMSFSKSIGVGVVFLIVMMLISVCWERLLKRRTHVI